MDMKSFKLWQLPGFMLCLLLGLVFFSSCDKDDDEAGGGGIMGYWLTDLRDMAREAVEKTMPMKTVLQEEPFHTVS